MRSSASHSEGTRTPSTSSAVARASTPLPSSASRASSYRVSAAAVFGDRPQPSYTLMDAALGYRWDVRGARLHVKLSGRNLLDEQVWETLIAEELDTRLRGRSAALELRAEF